MASKERIPVVSRLRRAIQKVKFLLSFDATKWIFSSLKKSQPPPPPRRLSFKTQPSLLDCTEDYFEADESLSRTASSSSPVSRTTSPGSDISRSTSEASSGDDIDERAERFIENFHRQLQMERQVSLELRYAREKSLERTTISD